MLYFWIITSVLRKVTHLNFLLRETSKVQKMNRNQREINREPTHNTLDIEKKTL